MDLNTIKQSIRNVPDFPKPGIQFKDISTLIKNHEVFEEVIKIFHESFKDKKIDVVIGIESRGFIFAAPLALKLGCSFVMVRKPGKLPNETINEEYELEYGKDKLEIHSDSIKRNDKVLIVDDLLATGGTALATAKLVERLGSIDILFCFLIKLKDLDGQDLLEPYNIFSLLEY